MAGNAFVKTLLKAAMPSVRKITESGKIDAFIQDIKKRLSENTVVPEGGSVEILVTTEEDGCEYANVVVIDRDIRVLGVLAQQKLSDLINTLLTQAEF